MSQQDVVLLLGSNLGDPKKNIEIAVSKLEKQAGNILKKSKFLKTNPVEFASVNIFYNFALVLRTNLSPIELLKVIKEIEQSMGRVEDSAVKGHYSDRVIDIDIVKYGNISYRSFKLEIPHRKHIYEREFSKKLLDELNNIE